VEGEMRLMSGTGPKLNAPEQLQDMLNNATADAANGTLVEENYRVLACKYGRYWDKLTFRQARNVSRDLRKQGYPEVVWISGEPGAGKTRLAIQMAECLDKPYFILDATMDKAWWDGYENERIIIIEDVDPKWISLDQLKALLDRSRETRVPIKGGMTYLTAEWIFLTSVPLHQDLYMSNELNRRVRHSLRLPPLSEVS